MPAAKTEVFQAGGTPCVCALVECHVAARCMVCMHTGGCQAATLGESQHQDATEGWGAGTGRKQACGWASWVPRSELVGTKATVERLTENDCEVGKYRGQV